MCAKVCYFSVGPVPINANDKLVTFPHDKTQKQGKKNLKGVAKKCRKKPNDSFLDHKKDGNTNNVNHGFRTVI